MARSMARQNFSSIAIKLLARPLARNLVADLSGKRCVANMQHCSPE